MIERYLHRLEIEDPGEEAPEATRRRLAAHFPAGSVRRMTQLGLLIGRVLGPLPAGPCDPLVYATAYGESRALEDYLRSFPMASPTLFQTSIHPSAVQQAMIARRQPIGPFLPLTGGRFLGSRALETALRLAAPRVILCGGEERGSWLREKRAASETTFAFAAEISETRAGALGKTALEPGPDLGEELGLDELFQHLSRRNPLRRSVAPGLNLILEWF